MTKSLRTLIAPFLQRYPKIICFELSRNKVEILLDEKVFTIIRKRDKIEDTFEVVCGEHKQDSNSLAKTFSFLQEHINEID